MGKGQCFSSARLLLGLFGLMLVFVSCNKRWQEEGLYYRAPNWTSDGKIVFMRDHYIQKFEQDPFWGGTRQVGGHQEIFVCEIDVGGKNFREVCKIVDEDFERGPNYEPASTSSWGDWVVVTIEDTFPQIGPHDGRMFVLKRDGSNLKEVGRGLYADIAPDQKKFVYQKFNQGLWIKNIDGSEDRQILADERARQPAWSSDGYKIAYVRSDSLGIWIIDTSGNYIFAWKGDSIVKPGGPGGLDWGPSNSNAIIAECGKIFPEFQDGFIVLYIDSLYYFFTSLDACVYRWSPDGKHFKAQDAGGSFIATFKDNFDVDLDTKWYLKP